MTHFPTPLFSYRHTPYRDSSAQKSADSLKKALSEMHSLDLEIEKIQTLLKKPFSFPTVLSTNSDVNLFSDLNQEIEALLQRAENETAQVIELEKKVTSLERKLKLEKEKTHTEALKILKYFEEQLLNGEKIIKARISKCHNLITKLQPQLEPKKTGPKITNLEKAPALILAKIQILEDRKKNSQQLLEDELKIIEYSLNYLTDSKKALQTNPSSLEQNLEPAPENNLRNSQPLNLKKTNPSAKKSIPQTNTRTPLDDDLLLEFAVANTENSLSFSKDAKKKNAPTQEFSFHRDEFNKLFHACLTDCLVNPLSIFTLKEKFLNSTEFSSKPHKELLKEVRFQLEKISNSTRFLESLKKENRQIYIFNNKTKDLVPLDQILETFKTSS